ncbi:MAG: CCA tRNA nucleotidyltransferase, partial [Candidatus Thorarchaeota archaeon]
IELNNEDSHLRLCVQQLQDMGINYEIHTIPKNKLKKINPKILEKITTINAIASKNEFSIAIVGGFVRDLLLGNPSQDVDFIIFKGEIDTFTELIAQKMGGKIGKMNNQTLTTQIRFPDDVVFEFNTTRKEIYEFPSRIPEVELGTIVDDLYRRDFTINAFIMFKDKYIDIFEGTKDLQNKIIKTTKIPTTVFREDYLRMFRAIRFACRLDFDIDDEVKDGIKENVTNILRVPKERILNELKLSLVSNPTNTFKLMVELDILSTLFPEIPNVPLNKEIYETNTTWEKISLKLKFLYENNVKDSSALIAAIIMELQVSDALLFEERRIELIKRQEIQVLLKKFKFSNKEIEEIILYTKYRNSLCRLTEFQAPVLELRLFLRRIGYTLENMIQLCLAENVTKKKKIDLSGIARKLRKLAEESELIYVVPELDGNEINRIFGFKGREIGEIKQMLSIAIMNEEIQNTKEDSIKYIREKLLKQEMDYYSSY